MDMLVVSQLHVVALDRWDEHGIALGSQVHIAAESFGTEVTEGELIAATRTRYTLRRSDDRTGTVNVHFPRMGFTLKKATT